MNRKTFIWDLGALTAGFSGLSWAGHPSYLNQSSEDEPLVVNAGVNGNNTRNLLARVAQDCLSHRPDLVILMVGTNDMNHGKYVPLNEYEANLTKLADQLTASGSRLLLLSMLPFYEPYLLTRHPEEFFQPEGPSGRRAAYNAVIEKVAHESGTAFFDIGKIFERIGKIGLDNDSLLRNEANSGRTDGVHPTPNGYRFLALAVGQFIQYHQLPMRRIVCFGDSITRGDGSVDKESYPAYLRKLFILTTL
ncbi:SGNH/GDSL hydrolase family protein [Parapedobacter koreensis]|uniref:Lysophospholipase L1 n=1 Tax=Parapedobacter koreensis TaxID=332977 RepID=A0A1H7SPN9_9SPHI|nr:SGNH/GDSL hydrolase family protein [Parapedobacter koreensis]SEL74046.1 Lysophospholipase L1 [Parapedobacter koreensis]